MARPLTAPVRKQVNLPPEIAERVDEFRFQNRFPSESEAIRRLIELGLAAAAGDKAATLRSVGQEDEARAGPQAPVKPVVQLDD